MKAHNGGTNLNSYMNCQVSEQRFTLLLLVALTTGFTIFWNAYFPVMLYNIVPSEDEELDPTRGAVLKVETQEWLRLLEHEQNMSVYYHKKDVEAIANFSYDNLENLAPGPFLPNYASPCWYETIDVPLGALYSNNCLTRKGARFPRLSERGLNHSLDGVARNQEFFVGNNRTWRLRCLPKVFMIGADKCGTTVMTQYLRDHLWVAKGAFKEIRYWTNFLVTCHSTLSDYADIFDLAAENIRKKILSPRPGDRLPYHPALAVDTTPSTYKQYVCDGQMHYAHRCTTRPVSIAHVIAQLIPEAKVIALVRNPVERACSSYFFTSSLHDNRTVTQETFEQEAKQFVKKFADCAQNHSVDECAIGMGFGDTLTEQERTVFLGSIFSVHLRAFQEVFEHNMLVISLEDLSQDPRLVRDGVFRFLDLPPLSRFLDHGVVNRGPEAAPMTNETRRVLTDFYRPFDRELGQLFGKTYL